MKWSYLEKVYFKKKTPDSLKKFKKQKNYCSRLYKKERKKYFESLDPRRISDNKSFWKNIQPFFSEKRKISNKITLVDNKENTIFDDHLVSEELNKFFENATRGLEINENSYIIDTDGNEINSFEKAINKYRNHPGVLLIKSRLKNIPSFSFNKVGSSEIERELNLIKNYRPVSVLPTLPSVSKIFERVSHRQVSSYVDQFLLVFMCGYRKGFSTQQALLFSLTTVLINIVPYGTMKFFVVLEILKH